MALEESAGLNLLFRLRGSRPPPPEVLIVAIDRPAAEALGLPANPNRWPRTQHADLVDALHRGGAAAIVFDVVFDEPGAPIDDRTLAEAIRRAGTVVLAQQLVRESVSVARSGPTGLRPTRSTSSASRPRWPPWRRPRPASRRSRFPRCPYRSAGTGPSRPAPATRRACPSWRSTSSPATAHGPLVELLKAAGARSSGGGRGARRRHAGPVGRRAGRPRRAGSSRAGSRDPGATGRARSPARRARRLDARVRRLLERLVRLYAGPDSPYLDFYGPPRTIPTIPYDRALARLAARDGGLDVRGKAVFIGLSSHTGAEQRDGVNTIFSEPNGLDLSGVEVAATAFANIAEARAVEPASARAELVLAIGWGLALGFLAWRLPLLASATLLPLAGLLYLVVARNRFTVTGLWLPLVGPLAVQIAVAFAASALWRHRDTRREREHLSTALAHYLPPKIAEELAREIGDVRATDQLGLRHVPVHGCSPVHRALGDDGARGAGRSHEPLLRGPVRAREAARRPGPGRRGRLHARRLGDHRAGPLPPEPRVPGRARHRLGRGPLQRGFGPARAPDAHRAALGPVAPRERGRDGPLRVPGRR